MADYTDIVSFTPKGIDLTTAPRNAQAGSCEILHNVRLFSDHAENLPQHHTQELITIDFEVRKMLYCTKRDCYIAQGLNQIYVIKDNAIVAKQIDLPNINDCDLMDDFLCVATENKIMYFKFVLENGTITLVLISDLNITLTAKAADNNSVPITDDFEKYLSEQQAENYFFGGFVLQAFLRTVDGNFISLSEAVFVSCGKVESSTASLAGYAITTQMAEYHLSVSKGAESLINTLVNEGIVKDIVLTSTKIVRPIIIGSTIANDIVVYNFSENTDFNRDLFEFGNNPQYIVNEIKISNLINSDSNLSVNDTVLGKWYDIMDTSEDIKLNYTIGNDATCAFTKVIGNRLFCMQYYPIASGIQINFEPNPEDVKKPLTETYDQMITRQKNSALEDDHEDLLRWLYESKNYELYTSAGGPDAGKTKLFLGYSIANVNSNYSKLILPEFSIKSSNGKSPAGKTPVRVTIFFASGGRITYQKKVDYYSITSTNIGPTENDKSKTKVLNFWNNYIYTEPGIDSSFDTFVIPARKLLNGLINASSLYNLIDSSYEPLYISIKDLIFVNTSSKIQKVIISDDLSGYPYFVWKNPANFSAQTVALNSGGVRNLNTDFNNQLICCRFSHKISSNVNTVRPIEDTTKQSRYYNRLQVSSVGNPFTFPLNNSYNFGVSSNKVFDVHPITELIPDTRFGDNPFHVFCDDGLWMTTKGAGEVLIESYFNFSDLFVPNRKSIVQTDIGLIFATKNDVYLLNGREMKKLSLNLTVKQMSKIAPKFYDENQAEITGANMRTLADLLWNNQTNSLNEYFGIFDTVNNELNYIDRGNEVSFCFNTETCHWTTKQFNDNFIGSGKVGWIDRLWTNNNGLISLGNLKVNDDEKSASHVIVRSRPIFTNATRIERILNIIAGQTTDFAENASNEYIIANGAKIRVYTSTNGVKFYLSSDNRFIEHIEGINGRINASAMYYIIEVEGTFNWLVFTGIFLQEKTKITQTQEVNIR